MLERLSNETPTYIAIYAHLRHRDYPWSVGRLKRLRKMPFTDDSFAFAERAIERQEARRKRKPSSRLCLLWRITT